MAFSPNKWFRPQLLLYNCFFGCKCALPRRLGTVSIREKNLLRPLRLCRPSGSQRGLELSCCSPIGFCWCNTSVLRGCESRRCYQVFWNIFKHIVSIETDWISVNIAWITLWQISLICLSLPTRAECSPCLSICSISSTSRWRLPEEDILKILMLTRFHRPTDAWVLHMWITRNLKKPIDFVMHPACMQLGLRPFICWTSLA